MWNVTYATMNDVYNKRFKSETEAKGFCEMIRKLYPGQEPTLRRLK